MIAYALQQPEQPAMAIMLRRRMKKNDGFFYEKNKHM